MDGQPKSVRKPRADSIRNRERVLAAAKALIAASGPAASLEAVAEKAGVGIGTLYRHFPTRQALFEAVYCNEVEQLVALADQLGAEAAPLDALRRWMHAAVEFVPTKKGLSAALAVVANHGSKVSAHSFDRLCQAAAALVKRAVDAGIIRGDIAAEDILRTAIGLCYMHDAPGWQANVHRLVDVFADGMRSPPL